MVTKSESGGVRLLMDEMGLRERKKLRRRSVIIKAAMELFAERGYAATTIVDIAEAAEVAPRTVSLYFPTKQEIALTGMDEAVERLSEGLRNRAPGEPILPLFGRWLKAELSQLDGPSMELVHRVYATNPELRALKATCLDEVMVTVERAVAEEMGAAVDDPRPQIVIAAMVGVFEFVSTAAVSGDIDENIDLAVDFLTAGMARLRRS